MGQVTVGDLFTGLDVFLGEKDLDLVLVLVPMGRIGNAGVVDSGQAKANNRSDIFGSELKTFKVFKLFYGICSVGLSSARSAHQISVIISTYWTPKIH